MPPIKRKYPPVAPYREYASDRNLRVIAMMEGADKSAAARKRLFDDPSSFAAKYSLRLSEDEIQGIRLARGMPLKKLLERMTTNPHAIFNSNCGCR